MNPVTYFLIATGAALLILTIVYGIAIMRAEKRREEFWKNQTEQIRRREEEERRQLEELTEQIKRQLEK